MYLRRVKRKCSVRGCKNTDCLAISKTHEIGNTVIICRDCLADGLKSADELKPDEKTNVRRESTEAPPLFFHPENTAKEEKTVPVVTENNAVEENGDKNIKKEGVKNEKQQKKSNAKQNEHNSKRG